MTWFRVGGAGIPTSLKNAMNAVLNKKFGTSGQNYPPKQWPDDVNLLGPLPEGTASGPIANFSDGADDVPVKSCIATIAPNIDGVSNLTVTQTDGNEPPTVSETYTVSLGRTVYGGTADIVTGEGKDGYGKTALDDKLYNYIAGITRFNVSISGIAASGYRDDIVIPTGYTISHQLITNASGAPDMTMCVYNGSLYVKNLSCSSRAELQSALNGESLVYPLATPNDFTFDGQEINSLYGVNSFWNNAGGDTTVVYRRDIDLALQAVSSSRGLMMASRPVTQLVGEESDPDQVNELVEDDENDIPEQLNEVVENDETEQEGEDDAR